MTEFRHVGTRADTDLVRVNGLSDLLVLVNGAGSQLYGAGTPENGLQLRDPDAAMAVTDLVPMVSGSALDAPLGLTAAQIDGAPALLIHGRYGQEIDLVRLDAQGGVASRTALRLEGAAQQALTALTVVDDADASLIVTASRQTPGLSIWRLEDERLNPIQTAVEPTLLPANDVFALETAMVGTATRLLALSAGGDSLLNFALTPEGQTGVPARLDLRDGLYLDTPVHLRTVVLEGNAYALIGASGSNSIAVVALEPNGGMRVTDHVADDEMTRFADVAVLETVTVDGQVYVVAGGSDDGLSLMTLLPGGRLSHVATVADDLVTALTNPAALALQADDTGIDIFAVGGTGVAGESGLTRLRVDLGQIGITLSLGSGDDRQNGTPGRDQIAGGAGNDTLSGGAGDDVLIDGAGSDVLYGGVGADVFVLNPDGQLDQIADFQLGIDRIDLSAMGRFYTVEALDIRPTGAGAEIVFGSERLIVTSADGNPITSDHLTITDLRDLWHLAVVAPQAAPLSLRGTPEGDFLDGRAGDDLLIGEPGDAAFDAVSAQVYRLYRATFDRDPDLRGLFNWSKTLLEGKNDLTGVAANFTGSAEFRATYGDTDTGEFVTLLYNNVLGRNPDPTGYANWTAVLDNGTLSRAEVLKGFSESREFKNASGAAAMTYSHAALQADFSDDVYRLYRATLDREPDPMGFRNWTDRLADGWDFNTVISGFTQSPEFRARYGETGDGQFVTLLYNNVLGRDPDPIGYNNWVERLGSGTWAREEVVRGFAQSPEFIRKTAPDLAGWIRGRGTDDVLEGQSGNNVLVGGIWADSFVFRSDAGGHHVVVDYEPWDRLVFEGFGFETPDQALDHMTQDGDDLRFSAQGVEVHILDTIVSDINF